jgi:hypothetical protein
LFKEFFFSVLIKISILISIPHVHVTFLSRGPEDELYIRVILETASDEHSRSASDPKLCIMDARAYSSAVANGYIGGGRENASKLRKFLLIPFSTTDAQLEKWLTYWLENTLRIKIDNYPNANISFMSLGNIHAIASSHASLLKAVSTQAESSNWHALIESTGWLTHVADLLKAAGGRDGIVGKLLQDNYSVLVVRISLNMLRLQPYMDLTDDVFPAELS